MSLGERIYKLRTEKEMSQGDLADALEVSRQSISKWETNGSVPELDKLVKLSEIFDISLDELITGKAPEKHPDAPTEESAPIVPPTEPKIIYVEKPVRTSFSPAQILGIILLFCSLSAFILFACFGEKLDIGEAVMLCLPVVLWGILCLVTKHPLLWCSWCGSATWWIYVFVLATRWEKEILFLIVGILLIVASLVYTIYLQKKERIHIPVWGWALLVLVLTLLALLLAVNLIPPSFGTVEHSTPVTSIPDASVGLESNVIKLRP